MSKKAVFDEKFNSSLLELQSSDAGRKILYSDWRRAIKESIDLSAEQLVIINDLPRTSILIIQRQFRKAASLSTDINVLSDEHGVHTLSIGDKNVKPGDPLIVVCDRRGDGKRKCRWFPKDRNRLPH